MLAPAHERCLLAYVEAWPTRTGLSFSWRGMWEWDEMTGSGSVRLRMEGRLSGRFRIHTGDSSTFLAERSPEPDEPIPDPPRPRDKWRRRW